VTATASSTTRGAGLIAALFPVTVVGLIVTLALAMNHTSYDIWGALIVAPVLLLVSAVMAQRAARRENDPVLFRIMVLGAAARLIIGAAARYWVANSVYGGAADATGYNLAGIDLAPAFRSLVIPDLGQISGTRFIEVLSGIVYALIGPTELGGFVVFAFFSFVGSYFFYRAFRLAYPEGDHKRYRMLVFFFPSLVFWPSAMGKEGWMLMVLGLCAYGTANLIARRARGLVWLGLGLWGTSAVRPHLSLAILCGLAVCVPLIVGGRRAEAATGLLDRRLARVSLVLLLVLASVVLFARAETFFGIENLDVSSAETQINAAGANTEQGGSAFTPSNATTPQGFAMATITVLLRPFPTEVHSSQGAIAGTEGLALAALLYMSLARLVRLPRELLRSPYIAFSVVFASAFVFAFSTIANFGILARERTQVLPVLFVLLSIAPRTASARRRSGKAKRTADRGPQVEEPSEPVTTAASVGP
jgi:hypothetical protein